MDVVYLIKNSQYNEELIYSLRSLVNLPHDRVFLVGGCPCEIDGTKVQAVRLNQTGDKFKNTQNNLKFACEYVGISEDFILMNDDFFILKPIKDPATELNLCRGTILSVLTELRKRHGQDSPYMASMAQTMVYLQDLGYKEPLSYELHTPMVINKNKFLSVFSAPYIKSIRPGHQRSLYGNMFLKCSQKIGDVKFYRDFVFNPGSDKFLSTEDNSWPIVKPKLEKLFPSKSEYEI